MAAAARLLALPLALSLTLSACGDDGGSEGTPTDAGSGGAGQAGHAGSGPRDAGPDAASDAAASDPARPDAGVASLPAQLSETGLYKAGSTEELAPGVMPYSPRYALWSDGASKQRWLLLPEDTQIDTSDMDSWVFPVGTKVWKEFARDGKRLETRLLWKTETGWLRVAYVWNDDESEAMATPRGAPDVRGTTHDVPERGACSSCHAGRDYLLGVSAIQLAHAGAGVTLTSLIADDRLSDPPADPGALSLPDTPTWNALGYLHANCGNCHNPKSDAWDRVDNFDLWLRVAELGDPMSTQSFRSTVSVALTDTDTTGGLSLRIAPGNAAMSGLIQRMSVRGSENAMPPLASERVDTDGVAVISGWIDDL